MCDHFTKMTTRLSTVLLVVVLKLSAAMDMSMYKSLTSFRDCLGKKDAGVCFKERALDALNETIMSDKPITFYNMVDIERNPQYRFNTSEVGNLPEDANARSLRLSDVLHDQVEEFFKSRVIKFSMAPIEEGRGKKDKGKGGMMMLAMGGMACMMAQMFMGKIAFLAGTALILAKVALFMSAIVGLKKLASGGGGGETQHVVYAAGGGGSDYGGGHGGGGGGGGWHRSLEGDAHTMAYRGYNHNEATGY